MLKNIPSLSEREMEVVRLSMLGLDTGAIAKALWLGEGTIKSHYRNISRKVGSSSRVQIGASLYQYWYQEAIAKEISRIVNEGVDGEARAILEDLAARVAAGEIDPLN